MKCPHCQANIPDELIPVSVAAKVMSAHVVDRKLPPRRRGKKGPYQKQGTALLPMRLIDRLRREGIE